MWLTGWQSDCIYHPIYYLHSQTWNDRIDAHSHAWKLDSPLHVDCLILMEMWALKIRQERFSIRKSAELWCIGHFSIPRGISIAMEKRAEAVLVEMQKKEKKLPGYAEID